jgi:HEAT repeat protein
MMRGILERQLDLFSQGATEHGALPVSPPVMAEDLTDAALISAIPHSSLAAAEALAAEAGRRRLPGAVGALAQLCGRMAGFGATAVVPEQSAGIRALGAISGPAAAAAVSDLIAREIVQGPTLAIAAEAAVGLGARLPASIVDKLLRHPDRAIRSNACWLAEQWPELAPALIDLLLDIDPNVARSAACALGHLGRPEARARLAALLDEDPGEDVIEAVSAVADEACMVRLGRIARSMPALADAALLALDEIDHPRARTIGDGIRGPRLL